MLLLPAFSAVAQTAEIGARVVDAAGKPVADAVVVAVPSDGALRLPSRPREGVVDQVDKEFTPKVTAILVGTPVTFPNNDNVRHQVYSFSPAKRFELPLYAGVPAQPVVFDKPGVVVLGCNIHDWMVGYVYVSESPYFAKTDKDGKASLADLPPRQYVVRVWHPQLEGTEEATRKTVDASQPRRADVEWTVKLKPEVKVRRAPTAERGGRY
jgi:plastocyanin